MIVNLTQHLATPEQRDAGVIDLLPEERARLQDLLTFDEIPSPDEMRRRAASIARLAEQCPNPGCSWETLADGERHYPPTVRAGEAMIGGAPFFMTYLEDALRRSGVTPLYAFTRRVSVEEGGVKKSVFRHEGFVGVRSEPDDPQHEAASDMSALLGISVTWIANPDATPGAPSWSRGVYVVDGGYCRRSTKDAYYVAHSISRRIARARRRGERHWSTERRLPYDYRGDYRESRREYHGSDLLRGY